ncbi:hypothetical protein [Paenibacillus lemnae]|uniref:Uncharacterized protein n=1 Tax=Paenibacillus lemnae TaxID=1330551 RepID=A0A848MC19_PAELE|nr:hypothetical protein [Paenibacillus lemnae]NMO97690.1 hypothetical protein [Paenibacillus lemnae]
MPVHEFVIENRSDVENSSYLTYTRDSNGDLYREGLIVIEYTSIDDEFIEYINDSLNWISTWNPSTEQNGMGLNHIGVTLIDGSNLITFKGIIQSWADMLKYAPQKIILNRSYCILKSDLLKKLGKLVHLIERAEIETKCILHLGI